MYKSNIQQLLQREGKTRYWLVKELNTTYRSIDNLINGTASAVYFETLEKLCKVFHCTLDDLFVFVDE